MEADPGLREKEHRVSSSQDVNRIPKGTLLNRFRVGWSIKMVSFSILGVYLIQWLLLSLSASVEGRNVASGCKFFTWAFVQV